MIRKFHALPLVLVAMLTLGGCSLFGGQGSSSKFCTKAKAVQKNSDSILPRDASDSANFAEAVKQIKELQKLAPSSLKSDIATLVDALDKLQKGDLQALAEPGFSAKVQSASKNVQQYLTKTCKITPPTTQ